MLTTTRYASPATRTLAQQLANAMEIEYVARGKKTIDQLAAYARRKGQERIVVAEQTDGIPCRLAIATVDETGRWKWAGEVAIGHGEEYSKPNK